MHCQNETKTDGADSPEHLKRNIMERTIYQVVMYKQNGSMRAHRNVLLETESLNEANEMLLNKYNELFGDEREYASTWEEAVKASEPFIDGAQDNSFSGLCVLKYDGYTYEVVEDLDD